jgi:glycosyltransferase involved in cell wall biosynthesis
MRILMLSQFYDPVLGGEEQHVRNLSRTLVARGHHVAVATLGRPDLPQMEIDQGVVTHRIPATAQRAPWLFRDRERRQVPPFPDPEATLALWRIVAAERPDVVHAHNWLIHSFLPLKAWSGGPLVLSMHDYSFACAKKSLMFQDQPCSGPAFRKCAGCAAAHYGVAKGMATLSANWAMSAAERQVVDLFIPVSRAVATGNQLDLLGLPYEVIHNFIPDNLGREDDPTQEATPYPALAELPDEPFLLFVGALGGYKGADVLVEAHAGLDDAPPLVLIGYDVPGGLTEAPPNVIVQRNWPHHAVMQAWRRCLAGIVPSTSGDSCPTVAMEAMSVGKPVIGSRIGGIPDLIDDGITGFLVPPGNHLALRTALAGLLDDPAMRVAMGTAALARSNQFRAGEIVPRIERAYQRLRT